MRLNRRKKAADWFTKLGYRIELRLGLRNIGAHYGDHGEFLQAKEYFGRAAALLQPGSSNDEIAAVWSDVALSAIELGKLDEAEAALNKALAHLNPKKPPIYEYSQMLISQGRVAELRQGKGDPLDFYRRTLAIQGMDHTSPLEARLRIAAYHRRNGKPTEAEREYRAALKSVADLRTRLSQEESQIGFVSTLIRIYQDYVDLLVETGRDREALLLADESRLQVFTERTGAAGRTWPPLQLDRLSKLLRASQTTALVYWLAPKRSFVWMLDGDGVHRGPDLESSKTLEPQLRAYVELVRSGEDPLQAPNRTALAAKLQLKSAKGRQRVVIVPDGGLHWLNFETLPADDKHYWIESATVSIAPSLRILAEATGSDGGGPALLVGDAVTSPGYERLKHAAGELRAIAGTYRAKSVLEGAAATPQAYAAAKLADFRDIHFAAHAEANPRRPLDSAVILSPGVGGGTRLTARDILLHPLKARLVTLSACSAAGAKSYGGEGLVGFAWAFLRAGADRVVAGLWKVDDESTSELMAKFYDELRTKPPADALREAKLSLLRQKGAFRKPYYWGPFQMYTSIVDSAPR